MSYIPARRINPCSPSIPSTPITPPPTPGNKNADRQISHQPKRRDGNLTSSRRVETTKTKKQVRRAGAQEMEKEQTRNAQRRQRKKEWKREKKRLKLSGVITKEGRKQLALPSVDSRGSNKGTSERKKQIEARPRRDETRPMDTRESATPPLRERESSLSWTTRKRSLDISSDTTPCPDSTSPDTYSKLLFSFNHNNQTSSTPPHFKRPTTSNSKLTQAPSSPPRTYRKFSLPMADEHQQLLEISAPDIYTDTDTDPTIDAALSFLHAIQHGQSLLHSKIRSLEAQISSLPPYTMTLAMSHIQTRLNLTSTFCHDLFLAEYAFRDVVDENRLNEGFDLENALEKFREEVEDLVRAFDVRMGEGTIISLERG